MTRAWLGLALALATAGAAAAAEEERPDPPAKLALEVQAPQPGAVLAPDAGLLFVTGRAFAHVGRLPRIDLVFVIDVSGSTAASSGADIDGDGHVGRGRARPAHPDSILGSETAAVAALLEQLDPRTTRVGIVAFSGGETARDAWLELPLTRDYAEVRKTLETILALGARGGTNMAAGLDAGARELMTTRLASRRQRVMVFLTDGRPTLPHALERRNGELAVEAARRAARRRIRIYSYAIGPEANESPEVMQRVAEVTRGRFQAVREPAELESMLDRVRFTELETLEVRNASTAGAVPAQTRPDGAFSALIRVEPGLNQLEVYARASDGEERSVHLEVTVTPDAPAPVLTSRQELELARLHELRRIEAARRDRERSRELEITPED